MLLINIKFNTIGLKERTKKEDEDLFPNSPILRISSIYLLFFIKKQKKTQKSFHRCFTQPNKNLVPISLIGTLLLCEDQIRFLIKKLGKVYDYTNKFLSWKLTNNLMSLMLWFFSFTSYLKYPLFSKTHLLKILIQSPKHKNLTFHLLLFPFSLASPLGSQLT